MWNILNLISSQWTRAPWLYININHTSPSTLNCNAHPHFHARSVPSFLVLLRNEGWGGPWEWGWWCTIMKYCIVGERTYLWNYSSGRDSLQSKEALMKVLTTGLQDLRVAWAEKFSSLGIPCIKWNIVTAVLSECEEGGNVWPGEGQKVQAS